MGRAYTRFASTDLGTTPAPVNSETIWLSMRPDVNRIVRVVCFGLLAVDVAICFGGGLPIIWKFAIQDRYAVVAALVGFGLSILVVQWVFLYYRSISWLPLSLGRNASCVMLRDRAGRVVASAPLGAVRTDGAHLLIGRRLVPLHQVYRDAYDIGLLRSDIIGRLPATAFTSRNALYWLAVRAGNHGLILAILFIGLVCLTAVVR